MRFLFSEVERHAQMHGILGSWGDVNKLEYNFLQPYFVIGIIIPLSFQVGQMLISSF